MHRNHNKGIRKEINWECDVWATLLAQQGMLSKRRSEDMTKCMYSSRVTFVIASGVHCQISGWMQNWLNKTLTE